MGDMGDDFKAFNEMKAEERAVKEPQRYEYAVQQFQKHGIQFIKDSYDRIKIMHVDGQIDFFPFTGWYCGRRPLGHIKGRGIANLIKAIKEVKRWT